MNDSELLRYSRHILLPQFGIEGQQRLRQSSALIVGAGGLGCPAALYLGAAGVGSLSIADADVVDLTNLQRQIGHDTDSIGQNKAASLAGRVRVINPEITLRPLAQRLEGEALLDAISQSDVVLDCSDNFTTRHAVNRACVSLRKPLVSGAAIGFTGQLAVFDCREPASPCYHCLFPDREEEGLRCSEAGVLSPLVGVIGALQALEAVKLLSGVERVRLGELLLFDAASQGFRMVRVPRDPVCPVCANLGEH